jgi:hypothetical protein
MAYACNMKAVTFIAGVAILAGLFLAIIAPTVMLAAWCLRRTGLSITQFAWLAGAWWFLWLGVRLFGVTFAYLKKKGEQRQRAGLFVDARAPSPIHRHLMN